MKLLSKVLKDVQYNEQNPLVLKNLIYDKVKRNLKPAPKEENNFFENEIVKDIISEAQKRASAMLKKAEMEARLKIEDAGKQAENIKKQAFDKGYEEGYKEGYKKAQDTFLKESTEKWEKTISQFNDLRKNLFEQNITYKKFLEKEALKLVLHTVEKVLNEKLEESSDYILNLVKKGMEKIGEEKDLVVRVSEKDFDRLDINVFKQFEAKGNKISLIKDPLLSLGDCIIEGNSFSIDAGVHTRIENIKNVLKEMGVINHE